MSTFAEHLHNFCEQNTNITTTENGAIAYRNSGNALTSFLFKLTYFRSHQAEIIPELINVLEEEGMSTTLKLVSYVGDIRHGLGERAVFQKCMRFLLPQLSSRQISAILPHLPELNRWDSITKLIDHESDVLRQEVIRFVEDRVFKEFSNIYNTSLMSKWLPSENTSSKNTRELAKLWRNALRLSPRDYRKLLVTLRKRLDLVETAMSANKWDEIDYKCVPSVANVRYAQAFNRHDYNRYHNFLASTSSSEMKSSVNTPWDIIRLLPSAKDTAEVLWKNLPQYELQNVLVVRDGSGSMQGRPMEVADSLTLYFTEHNEDIWKGKFITFSNNPQYVELDVNDSLWNRQTTLWDYDDITFTNVEGVMDMVLSVAIANKLSQSQLPTIMIISDMQFNCAVQDNSDVLFKQIAKKYERHGYQLPRMIFWNVSEHYKDTVPMQKNENGLLLCSGFNPVLANAIMSNEEDCYKAYLSILQDNYSYVDTILAM